MHISFVIPVVSFKPILQETLTSIFSLDGVDAVICEVLIIQNGDPQIPPDWVSMNPLIRCIHEPEKSIPKARNIGLNASQGNFIAYFDEDSVCPSGWLREALSFFQSKNVGAYQSPSKVQDEIIRFEENYLSRHEFQGIIFFDTAASLFRREALIDVGGFDESFKRVEDLDMGTKLSRRGWVIAFGTQVVEGRDSNSFLKALWAHLQSVFHSKRLHIKYQIRIPTKIISPDFRLFGKKTKSGGSFERLLFYLLRPRNVKRFDLKSCFRFAMIFLDYEGRSHLIKNRFSILLTTNTVILLIDWRLILASNDPYFYQLVSHSDKLVTVEMSQVEDQEFLKKLATHFISGNGPVSLS